VAGQLLTTLKLQYW